MPQESRRPWAWLIFDVRQKSRFVRFINLRNPMKASWITSIAVAGTISAADPQEFTFKDTPIGVPPLSLSRVLQSPSRETIQIPAFSSDLIAPASTRDMIIRDFQSREHASNI